MPMYVLHQTETYRAHYYFSGPMVVVTELATGRVRSMQGEEAIEFMEAIENYLSDTTEEHDEFFNDACSNHFLEDNEDDYERGLV